MQGVLLTTGLAACCCGVAMASGPAAIDPAVRARSMLNAAVTTGLIGSPDAGPDVIVGELTEWQDFNGQMGLTLAPFGTVGTVSAYAVGTTSCNIGTSNLLWISGTNQHPVIAQNYYRLKDGRLEQIGIGWLKHGFFALTYNACSNENYFCNGQGGSVLGVGCSDPYDVDLNGSQSNLGPRYQVNASTGVFPYPYANHPNTNVLSKRIQINHSDIEGTATTRYFAEGMYITQDDTAAGNNANNASYRRMTVNATTRVFTLTDQTMRRKPAIHAWKDYGGPGGTTDPNVVLNSYDIQGDGRYWVASKATSLGGGLWHYEYCVQNLTSDRAAGSVTVGVPACATVTNPGFHDVQYHSGEPQDGADWTYNRSGAELVWTVNPPPPPPLPPALPWQHNVLRWGTLYNYRFDSNLPPKVDGTITIGLFKPPTPSSPAASFAAAAVVPRVCRADFNNDCNLTIGDFGAFQAAFVAQDPRADFNGDGQFTIADFGAFQAGFVAGCQ